MTATVHAGRGVPTEPETPKKRDPFFDNAKMLLVTLVVVGHAWGPIREHWATSSLYDFLYLWHMPAFVMITGYLSRSFTYSRRNLSRLVTSVLVPYLVFEAALAAFRILVGGEELELLFADPHWPMWYLAALFLWRLATPVLRASPAPVAVAVAVSLLGGLVTTDIVDFPRATGFLPFFVIGLLATPEHVERLRRPAARLAAAGALLVAAGLAPLMAGRFRTEWLYWRSSYAQLDVSVLEGMSVSLGLLVVCTTLALSALSLMPSGQHWFTKLGAATIVVYLFHGFAVKGAEYAGLAGAAASYPLATVAAASVAAVALAVVLGLPAVATRLNAVVDPVGTWQRRGGRGGPTARADQDILSTQEQPATVARIPWPLPR